MSVLDTKTVPANTPWVARANQLGQSLFNLTLPTPFDDAQVEMAFLVIAQQLALAVTSNIGKNHQKLPEGIYIILKLDKLDIDQEGMQGLSTFVIEVDPPR